MTETRFTLGPWEYVPSNEHHGPYVCSPFGGDICDCYTMSNLREPSIRNGGTSKPIHFMHEQADANARLIAAAPELLNALAMTYARLPDSLARDLGSVEELLARLGRPYLVAT